LPRRGIRAKFGGANRSQAWQAQQPQTSRHVESTSCPSQALLPVTATLNFDGNIALLVLMMLSLIAIVQ
jgi:hypothetical protein